MEKPTFGEFGLAPVNLAPPDGPVRAYFPWYQVLVQTYTTGLVSLGALAAAAALTYFLPFPWGLLAAPLPLGAVALLVYHVTRLDSAWIEIDGDTLRAKHLYTRGVTTRRVEEVLDLLTHVLSPTQVALLVSPWLGRIRAIEVRFRDGGPPMWIARADPAMRRAQELVEAILYRMSFHGPLDYDVVMVDGRPLVQRVFWARDKVEVGPLLRDEWARRRPATPAPAPRAIAPLETTPQAPTPTGLSPPPPHLP